jgi:Patatin-like phospholipase
VGCRSSDDRIDGRIGTSQLEGRRGTKTEVYENKVGTPRKRSVRGPAWALQRRTGLPHRQSPYLRLAMDQTDRTPTRGEVSGIHPSRHLHTDVAGNSGDITHCPRILSLDGGGVRGLSSLLILREIMEEIGRQSKVEETPLPCEYFDLIGGTGTGGLIAIMLGRLRMVRPLKMKSS